MPFLSALDTAEIADAVGSTMNERVTPLVPGAETRGPYGVRSGAPAEQRTRRARVLQERSADRILADRIGAATAYTVRVDADAEALAWDSRVAFRWERAVGGPLRLQADGLPARTVSGRFLDLTCTAAT